MDDGYVCFPSSVLCFFHNVANGDEPVGLCAVSCPFDNLRTLCCLRCEKVGYSPMIIYPAIDLRDGKCVRLQQGDPNAQTIFDDDPVQVAQRWAAQGAEWLHIVNLDGALNAKQSQLDSLRRVESNILVQPPGTEYLERFGSGSARRLPINLRCLRDICAAVDCKIQFGGGLRTLQDIRLALELGADRVVLGTVAVEEPAIVQEALALWGSERVAVGLDARDGLVATHGWQETSDLDLIEMGHRMAALGVEHVLFTDIERDGMMGGVNLDRTARLADTTGLSVIASGGVADIHDIERLKQREHYNIGGVVIGRALYTGDVDLGEALATAELPLAKHSAGIVPFRRFDDGVRFLMLFNFFFEKWHFPRGGVEAPEDLLDCAVREFTEETSLRLKQLYADCRTDLHYVKRIRHYELERTVVYFLGEAEEGEVALCHDNHCEIRWFTPDETWAMLTETSPEQLPAFDRAMAYMTEHGLL